MDEEPLDPRLPKYLSCMQCGSCASSCPAVYAYHQGLLGEEFNPMKLVGLMRLHSSPDGFPVDKCFHCYTCKWTCRAGNSVSDLVKVLRERKRGVCQGSLYRSLYEKGLCLTPESFRSGGWEDWRGFDRVLEEMPRVRRELGLEGLYRKIPEEALQQVQRLLEVSPSLKLNGKRYEGECKRPNPPGGIYLFKSCVMDSHYPGVTLSLKYLLERLNVSYLDDERQSSCGGFGYYADEVSFPALLVLNARNFALAEEGGFGKVATVCVTSYGILTECWELLGGKLGGEVNELLKGMGMRYRGKVGVYHLSEILHAFRGKLRSLVSHGLSGLRVAVHHGCHYTKMFREYATPNLLEELVAVTGAEVVDYEEKNLCCGMGFRHTLENRELVRSVALRKLRALKNSGARIVVHACPGCQMTLDRNQKYLEERTGEDFGMVHMNYGQLLALSLGADPWRVVGIQTHSVSPQPLLEELRLA
ncbi:MAG: heterodisulfide reductase-related iron-sulfur binding cluster [Candidatus Hadarchaeales archaeon]